MASRKTKAMVFITNNNKKHLSETTMKILISGSHGFIGSAVYRYYRTPRYRLLRLIRPTHIARSDEIVWQPLSGFIHHNKLDDIDAVIHLAGEPIFGRWNEHKKQAIYNSRVIGTDFLARTLAALANKPRVLLCASAVGYYGSPGDTAVTETAPPGSTFLARVCRDTEAAAQPAADAGIRTIALRFGIVLGQQGGALAKMLPAFRLALGGPLGDGRQWLSWISLADCVGAIDFALTNESLSGPVNITAPEPVRNADFARALGKALHRPARLPVPAKILRLAFDDLADEALLSSTRALPEKLTQAGGTFQHPTLQSALENILRPSK